MDALFNSIVAELYDGVFQVEFGDFCRFALELSNRVVERDRVCWASGVLATFSLLHLTVIKLEMEHFKVYQDQFLRHDLMLARAVRHPNLPVRYEDMGADRESGMRVTAEPLGGVDALPYLFAQTMVTASRDDATNISEMHSQYRDDPARPFTDEERERYRLLFPHINAAWRHRQLLKLYEENRSGPAAAHYGRRGNAVIGAEGLIEVADALFSRAMLNQFKDWRGPYLPAPLQDLLKSGVDARRIGDLEFRLTRGERHILSVSERAGGDALTPAERRAAELFAEGHTYSDVAHRLGVSKSTIRNQISAVYRKLDIHSKVELVRGGQG